MSDPTQSLEAQLAELRSTIRGLAMAVEQISGIVRILDQYMLLNKKFFDQVKITEPTPAVTPEIVEAIRTEEKK